MNDIFLNLCFVLLNVYKKKKKSYIFLDII